MGTGSCCRLPGCPCGPTSGSKGIRRSYVMFVVRAPAIHLRCSSRTALASTKTKTIVLTREKGKNEKLRRAVEDRGWNALEIPLVKSVEGSDVHLLPEVLEHQKFDWIVLTSPEAASVFIKGWRSGGEPEVRIAAVGQGTADVLLKENERWLVPEFMPSVANAKYLSKELPGAPGTVLYPASAKARMELEDGLHARGFIVKRLNTYNTVANCTHEPDVMKRALVADVVTFGSPSAVKAWVKMIDGVENMNPGQVIACIGETSAIACNKVGLSNVYYPEKPGVEGWVKSIEEGLGRSVS